MTETQAQGPHEGQIPMSLLTAGDFISVAQPFLGNGDRVSIHSVFVWLHMYKHSEQCLYNLYAYFILYVFLYAEILVVIVNHHYQHHHRLLPRSPGDTKGVEEF